MTTLEQRPVPTPESAAPPPVVGNEAPLAHVFPEYGAGGFTRLDGTVEFYFRVNALMRPTDVVVDLGAGRGKFLEDPVPARRELQRLWPRCGELIGLDVDAAVTENPALTRAEVYDPDGAFPLADSSVDMIVSNWTFEHVANPGVLAAEIHRVLRPGGWLCARTPRKWGVVGMSARLVPNVLHHRALARLQPAKQERDTFPVAYELNSREAIRRWFPERGFDHHVYAMSAEPSYVGGSTLAMRTLLGVNKVLPSAAGATLMVFLQKR
ncbi:methyltransferase domain-containing protein [Actinomycetospora sp. NBRC 106378]|uniref:methyltransferase domain-containing protein n=1 Tax=Actinomycetospora sp. NBRC 106378 TaxID=3032208 RepID=UPI0024A25E9C|nr:methyltransferase domain-containing protein [Actinomycetospora sp. NBRC 106378]GLZ51823.1 SAM-dependent methyltransferase [Actinomycetospora sp. NBRC 106378]